VGDHLLAVLGEALSNAARHSHADRVTVAVEARRDLVLRVADDGVGIEPGARRSGLHNMAERAKSLGGDCSVGPGEEGGTVVEWRVPLSADTD
jgi:signal transduction histidine kinase